MRAIIGNDALAKGYFNLAWMHRMAAEKYMVGDYRRAQHLLRAEKLDEQGASYVERGNMGRVKPEAVEVRHG